MNRTPTIDDVASIAKVGRSTVSRVLNGSPKVSPEVRERVLNTVQALNYRVNRQARALAGGRLHLLALVYASDLDTEPNSFYHSGLELGALRACGELGFNLMTQAINQNAGDAAEQILEMIDARRCDGLILSPPFSDDLMLLDQLNQRNFPVVCISSGRQSQAVASSVGIDDEAAGYDAACYLIGLGHNRFGFIRGPERHISADGRFTGFLRALRDHGLDEDAYVAERGNFTFHSGVESFPVLYNAPLRPTAIICGNDDMAVGAMFSAHRMALAIPGDISIVGFDDTPVSEIVWPPMTTVRHPVKQIGYEAVGMLHERNQPMSAPIVPRTTVVAHAVNEARRKGFAFGVVRGTGTAAYLLANLVMGFVLARAGPVWVVVWVAVAGALLGGTALLLLPATPVKQISRAQSLPPYHSLVEPLRQPMLALAICGGGCIQASHGFYYSFSTILWQRQGLGDWVGPLWAFAGLSEVLFLVFLSPLRGRLGAERMLLLSGTATVFRWAAMGFTAPLAGLFALQALHALSFAGSYLATLRLVERFCPPHAMSAGLSLNAALSSGIPIGLVTLSSGTLFTLYGAQAYWTMSLLALIGTTLAGRLVLALE